MRFYQIFNGFAIVGSALAAPFPNNAPVKALSLGHWVRHAEATYEEPPVLGLLSRHAEDTSEETPVPGDFLRRAEDTADETPVPGDFL